MKTAFAIVRSLLVALLTAGVLAGCVPLGIGMGAVVPVPRLAKKKIEQGREITAREVEFVMPGRTTKAEVITRLGTDFRDSPRVAALAFSWQYNGFRIIWDYGFIGGHGQHGVEDFGWRALFVAFDQNDRVVQIQFYRLRGGKSLDEQLEDWAQRNGVASLIGKHPCVSLK
jgi:outer membrane protein assembly factor BamE (lipoprotein component of BamABCDE complex)